MVLLEILGIFDIIVGVTLAVSNTFSLAGSALVTWIAILILIKSLYSIIASAAVAFYFDVMGWLDIISAVSLFLALAGVVHEFFIYFGILMIVKGVYSFAMGFASGS